jgi:hypothetical protein
MDSAILDKALTGAILKNSGVQVLAKPSIFEPTASALGSLP